MRLLARVEVKGPCGFQKTFFECPPDHMVVWHRCYGFTQAQAQRRADRWTSTHGDGLV